MVGHKLGEFVATRRFGGHGAKADDDRKASTGPSAPAAAPAASAPAAPAANA